MIKVRPVDYGVIDRSIYNIIPLYINNGEQVTYYFINYFVLLYQPIFCLK